MYLQRRLLETGIQLFSVCFDTWNLSTKEVHVPEKVFCKHHLMLPGFLHPSSPWLSLACKSVSLCISCAENALKHALSGSWDKSSGLPSPRLCVSSRFGDQGSNWILSLYFLQVLVCLDSWWDVNLTLGAERMVLVISSLPSRVTYTVLQPVTEQLCCIHCGTSVRISHMLLYTAVQCPFSYSPALYENSWSSHTPTLVKLAEFENEHPSFFKYLI